MTNSKQKKNDTSLKPFIFGSIAVVIICASVAKAIYSSFPNWAERGEFGDSFGAVNALFSGLAFAGIIYTILLQRRELQLQREELELTRDELKRSADAQEKSQQELVKQLEFNSEARQQDLIISNINDWTDKVLSSIDRYTYGKLEGVGALDRAIQELLTQYSDTKSKVDKKAIQPYDDALTSLPKVLYVSIALIISDIEALLQYIITKQPKKELFEVNLNIIHNIIDHTMDNISKCDIIQADLIEKGLIVPETYLKITLTNIKNRLDIINTFK